MAIVPPMNAIMPGILIRQTSVNVTQCAPKRSEDADVSALSPWMQLRSQRYAHIVAFSTNILQWVGLEIIGWIIDFLQDDLDTLKNSSLVCRAWLPTARFHPFRHVMLSKKRAGPFIRLISGDSTVSSSVRSLCIGDSMGQGLKADEVFIKQDGGLESPPFADASASRYSWSITLLDGSFEGH
jgi:hypothetical protein